MKLITELIIVAAIGLPLHVNAQGVFAYSNGAARTRLITPDGPFAGTHVYAQMLAGPTASSLQPVGPVAVHINGFVHATRAAVPGVPPYQRAYVQMVAWDSTFWGESLSGVPLGQQGWTDIVTVFLINSKTGDPPEIPRFTRPAIVPPIPEPPVWSLGLLGGLLGLVALRARRMVTR